MVVFTHAFILASLHIYSNLRIETTLHVKCVRTLENVGEQ